jgi:hypothetical protein
LPLKTRQKPHCGISLGFPSMDGWRKKMWPINKTEYYSAIKKNEIMSFAGRWMELKIINVSEVS